MKEQDFVKEVNQTRKIPCWSDFGEIIYRSLKPREEFLGTDPIDGGWIYCALHRETYTFDSDCPKCHPLRTKVVNIICWIIAISIATAWLVGLLLYGFLSSPK